MVWLHTIIILVAFFILILFSPINLTIKYSNHLDIKIKLIGIPFPVYSNQHKESRPMRSSKNKIKKHSKKDILKSLENVGKLLKISKKAIVYTAKKVKINTLKLILYIGAEDAAKTAIRYGQANAIIYPTLAIINTISVPKKTLINIIPNFPNEKIDIDFKISLKSSTFNLLTLAIMLFKKYKEIT